MGGEGRRFFSKGLPTQTLTMLQKHKLDLNFCSKGVVLLILLFWVGGHKGCGTNLGRLGSDHKQEFLM